MGRHERLVRRGLPHRTKLALWLREQRSRARLTYRELGERTYRSPGVLARAASGKVVPTWDTVEAYAHGCGANLAQASRLWRRARAEQHEPMRWSSRTARRLHPEYLKDFRGLQLGMIALRRECGQPTFRELEEIAAAQGSRLPRSTLSAVLHRRAIPSESLMLAFVRACATQRRHVRVDLWMAAWQRAEHNRQNHRYRPSYFSDSQAALESNQEAIARSVTRAIRDLLDRHHSSYLSVDELAHVVTTAAFEWQEQRSEADYENWLSQHEPMGVEPVGIAMPFEESPDLDA